MFPLDAVKPLRATDFGQDVEDGVADVGAYVIQYIIFDIGGGVAIDQVDGLPATSAPRRARSSGVGWAFEITAASRSVLLNIGLCNSDRRGVGQTLGGLKKQVQHVI